MRVGVTGSTGILGTRICASLQSRQHVVVPFRSDIRNVDELRSWAADLDLVIHCAALVPVREVAEQLDKAIGVNVAGTANVARAVAARGCRLAYVSTSHVYRSGDRPLRETDPIAPISAYGMTKYQGELWVQDLVKHALTIRVFSYFDARQAPTYLVPGLRQRILGAPPNGTLDLDGADNIRDIADARWVGEVCVRLALESEGGIVNCGTGHGLRVADIAEAVRVAMGRPDVAFRRTQSGPVNGLVADTTQLHNRLSGVPPFNLDEALRELSAA